MEDFLKFTLATVTGIIVSSVVLFFISILVVFSMVSSSESETQVRKNSVMMLDLNGTLAERSQENPLDILMKDDYKTYGLDDVLSSIRKAKENENIKGIYIQANSLSAGYASLEEIRHALKDFKESGKFIVAYGDSYTQSLYYLSSIADKVMLNPQGMLEWRGLAATPMFFKDLLEKIGVEMQVFKVGTYKSAVEPFIATEMSPANREQVNVYLSSVWGQITGDIAESRNLSVEALNKEADRMLMFYPAEESVKNGLVDTLIYKNDVRDYLKTLVGIDKDDDMPVLGIQDMVNVKKNVPKDKSGNVIAVYYAYGEIDGGSSASTEEGINSEKVIRDLRKLKDDENVKGRSAARELSGWKRLRFRTDMVCRRTTEERETSNRVHGRLCSIRRLLHCLQCRHHRCRTHHSDRLYRHLWHDAQRQRTDRETRPELRRSKDQPVCRLRQPDPPDERR